MMRFRPATTNDVELLLEWRNDPDTRKFSIRTDKVKRVEANHEVSDRRSALTNQPGDAEDVGVRHIQSPRHVFAEK